MHDSEQADFLPEIPRECDGLYAVVPQARVRDLLEIRDDRYSAVLSDAKGCANSGVLVQQVLAYLERRYAGRFRFVDRTDVARIVVRDDEAVVSARGHQVTAAHVVLCTNRRTYDRAHDTVTLTCMEARSIPSMSPPMTLRPGIFDPR